MSLGKTVHVLSPKMMAGIGQVVLEVRAAIVLNVISSSFLAKLRFLVTRRCNTVENIYNHKVISPWDRVIFVRERDRGNYKESAVCAIIKASNSSHFHIPLIFCSLLSQPCSIRYVFSIPFLILEIQKIRSISAASLHHQDSNMFRRFNKVKSCSVRLVLGWVTKYEYPVLQQ